jgi:hypothetical protein
MNKKEDLKTKIQEKERLLSMAQGESDAWNKGKYKSSSNAQMSKILVESFKKEISSLRKELSDISGEST